MPVTELAILRLRGGHDHLELLEALMDCQELQDEWTHDNQPCNLRPDTNLSSMYLDEADPPSLLITAPWDSPEAHGEWIQSRENQDCNGKLSQYLRPGCDSTLLFHLTAAGSRPQMRTAFESQRSFNVCRLTVRPADRDALQKAYRELEEASRDRHGEPKVWGGWNMEKTADGDAQDLVVFWSDQVPEERLEPLMRLSDNVLRRRFTHLV